MGPSPAEEEDDGRSLAASQVAGKVQLLGACVSMLCVFVVDIDGSCMGAESQKTLVTHGYKPWVTNLAMVPHTLGIPTANISH